ncbi:hypothetical protein GGI43DRAFT_3593 [Trichoderma evansii]
MAQNDQTVYVYSTQHEDGSCCYKLELNHTSIWHTSGGVVSYRGKHMLLTSSQVLGYRGDDYEIVHWDIAQDNHDDEDGEEAEARERQGSVSDAGEDDGSESGSSYGPVLPVTSDPIFPSEPPVMRSQELIGRGNAIVRMDKLDYALIEVRGLNSIQTSSAVSLNDWDKIVVHRDESMQVTAVTPSGGYIRGTRSPGLCAVRLPGSSEYLQVYEVSFAGSLGPGHSGSWVWDTGIHNLLGHVITVRFSGGSEIALIMPAKDVFEHARAELDSRYEID